MNKRNTSLIKHALLIAFLCFTSFISNAQMVALQKAIGSKSGEYSGNIVDIDGDYAVVASYFGKDEMNNKVGKIDIYHLEDDTWELDASFFNPSGDASAQCASGHNSVAISGTTIVVGSLMEAGIGAIYIFDKMGDIWTNTIVFSPGATHFGRAVAIYENTIVVGTKDKLAYVYEKQGQNWIKKSTLKPSDMDLEYTSSPSYASTLAIDQDIILVGDYDANLIQEQDGNPTTNKNGTVYRYINPTPGSWPAQELTETSLIKHIEKLNFSEKFGHSIDIEGDRCLIGVSNLMPAWKGGAYLYKNMMNEPELEHLFEPWYLPIRQNMGTSVSMSGNKVLIGASTFSFGDDPIFDRYGAVYFYEQDNEGVWHEQFITDHDGQHNDYFGESVAISGDRALIGAYGDDDNGTNSGSAFFLGEQDLCNASGNTNSAWLGRFTLGKNPDNRIRYISGNNGGYGDFRDQFNMILERKCGYNVTITPDGSANRISGYYGVWIDFDKDGVYENNEKVYTDANSDGISDGNFFIPENAITGQTAMRVIFSASQVPSGCGAIQSGEAEDYLVVIANENIEELPEPDFDYNILPIIVPGEEMAITPNLLSGSGSHHVQFDFTDNVEGAIYIEVIDAIDGSNVYSIATETRSGMQLEVPLTFKKSGMYIVNARTQTGTLQSRVVVQ